MVVSILWCLSWELYELRLECTVTNPAATSKQDRSRIVPPNPVAVEAFNFKFVVSSDRYTGSFRIVTGGTGCDDFTTNLSGTVTVPYTGGWQEYVDFTV